jgi:hypothetical protein
MKLEQKIDTTQLPNEEHYLKWKDKTNAVIKQLKEEMTSPIEDDASLILTRIELRNASVHRIFSEAKQIANERFTYFEKQINNLVSISNEYAKVDLSDKDLAFLQIFRSQIRKTIKKYMKYNSEMETFFHEFRNKFSRLVHKGEELSYMNNNNKAITLVKDNHHYLTKTFGQCLRRLTNLRIKSFRLMKKIKNKEI